MADDSPRIRPRYPLYPTGCALTFTCASLPVNLAAQVCNAGAAYWHLSLELPAELRGRELAADDLERLGARVEPFDIRTMPLRAELK